MTHGVNAVGDFRVESGLGQAAARLVSSMALVEVPVALQHAHQHVDAASAARGSQLEGLPQGRRHAIDLWCLNVNEFVDVPLSSFRPAGVRYTIALWAWESASLPDAYARQFDKVDEVWVPSRFTQRCLSRYTTKPVVVVPNVVPVLPAPEDGADDGHFDVLYSFDAWSSLTRKNPLAVIDAVEEAARRDPVFATRVRLTIKAKHLDSEPAFRAELRARMSRVGGTLLESNISRAEMDVLLGRTHVFLSLHRAEGFGLGMAEAMALGRTVIGTGWSGNVDFMNPANSVLVPYAATRTGLGGRSTDASFVEDDYWADPDVLRAADALLEVFRSSPLREALGAAARDTVRRQCSPDVVGALVARRLAAVGAALASAA